MQIVAKRNDFIWNGLGLLFKMFSSFLLLPFIVALLSADLVGLWYAFLAIYNFVVLFQLGFTPSFARSVAYCLSGARSFAINGKADDYGEDIDPEVFDSLILALKSVYLRLASVSLIVVAIIGTCYIFWVSYGIEPSSYVAAWIIFCAAIFLNMNFSYFEAVLRGLGCFPEVNKSVICASILQFITTSILLAFDFGLTSCAVGFLVQGLAFRALCSISLRKQDIIKLVRSSVERKPDKTKIRGIRKSISVNAYKDTAVSISNYFLTTGNTLLCTAFVGLGESGIYSIVLQLFNACAGFAGITSVTYQPSLQSAFANGNSNLERSLSGKALVAFIIIYLISAIAIVSIVLPLLSLIRETFENCLLLSVAIGFQLFIWKQTNICATFINNTNHIPYTFAFIFTGVSGFTLSCFLLFFTGGSVYSLVFGNVVAMAVYNAWKWPVEAAKRLNCSFFGLLSIGIHDWIGFIQRKQKRL